MSLGAGAFVSSFGGRSMTLSCVRSHYAASPGPCPITYTCRRVQDIKRLTMHHKTGSAAACGALQARATFDGPGANRGFVFRP